MLKCLFLAVTIVSNASGYYTALANHLKRWLGSEGVGASVVTAQAMPAALQREKLAFLVGFENPTSAQLATLREYRRRGGRLVVFHSGSAALGNLMGVQPVGYAAAPYPGAWSRMSFAGNEPVGQPVTIRQDSGVLQRARPVPGRGRVIATWGDRQGRSTGEPAWIATDAGYWMTHVLLADGDEDLKACLLGALVGSVDPKAWTLAAHRARTAAREQAWRKLALAQQPRPGEIHAVWDHSGTGLYPGDWPRTFRVLKAAHVTDLFVNVAGAGFAHYPSAVLPRSKTFAQEGDQLAQCLAAVKGTGIRVHAWLLAFSATRATPAQMDVYARKGWRLKSPDGRLSDYLDPANPAVRAQVLAAMDEIQARYPVAGIHLDFVRWGDGVKKPATAAATMTQFVAEARRHVKRPRWLTAAVYGKYPQCVASVGQDWERWIDLGLVDYCVPMNYTDSTTAFAALLAAQARSGTRARHLIAGLGVTANESRLDAAGVIGQVNLARQSGLAGVALFDLDPYLERKILPYLGLRLW